MNQQRPNATKFVPRRDCNRGCSDDDLGDGFCNSACNVAACEFDYGDCENGSNVDLHSNNTCPQGTEYTLSPTNQCQKCTCDPSSGRVQCRNGERVRKEIHDLSDEEFKKYADAITLLKDKGLWEPFIDLHTFPGWRIAHGPRSHFFHWHRKFLYDMETTLIQETGDCSIAIPYWDWAMDASPKESEIWESHYFGVNNPGNVCVDNGHFKNWSQSDHQVWWVGSGVDLRGCIQRKWESDAQFASLTRLQLHKFQRDHEKFQDDFENDHGVVHCSISGHMCVGGLSEVNGNVLSGVSPYDPIFYTHHAMMDRTWHDRQQLSEANLHWSNAQRVGHDELLGYKKKSGETYTVADVADNSKLKANDDDAHVWPVRYLDPERLAGKTEETRPVAPKTKKLSKQIKIQRQRIDPTGSRGGPMWTSGQLPTHHDAPQPANDAPCSLAEALCIIQHFSDDNPNFMDTITPCCPPDDLKGRLEYKKKQRKIHELEEEAIEKEIAELRGTSMWASKSSRSDVRRNMNKALQAAQEEIRELSQVIRNMEDELRTAQRKFEERGNAPLNPIDAALCMDSVELVRQYKAGHSGHTHSSTCLGNGSRGDSRHAGHSD